MTSRTMVATEDEGIKNRTWRLFRDHTYLENEDD